MSANLRTIRRIYEEGLIDQDPEWLLELATPDIEYVNPSNAVEPGVRRGPTDVVRAMRGFGEMWDESRHGCTSSSTAATSSSPPSPGTP